MIVLVRSLYEQIVDTGQNYNFEILIVIKKYIHNHNHGSAVLKSTGQLHGGDSCAVLGVKGFLLLTIPINLSSLLADGGAGPEVPGQLREGDG